MHIGLVGGIGPAATEFYYRGLVARHAGSAKPMELTIVHAGTDLFLAFDGRACGFPVADCAEIHMDALHRTSVGEIPFDRAAEFDVSSPT